MRKGYLDALRGLAVIWMIIFHFSYDLHNFGYVNWDFNHGFWFAFPRVIAFTFLFCVGLSLNYTHAQGINWAFLKKRSFVLGSAALIISIATYYMFPDQWIYFGTLHCILAGTLLGAPLVKHRHIAFVIFLTILILQYGLNYDIKWLSSLLQKRSMDFIPIYPWFWTILLGLLIGPYLDQVKALREFPTPRPLTFLGQHSLKIYLIHQPLFFALLMGFRAIQQ